MIKKGDQPLEDYLEELKDIAASDYEDIRELIAELKVE